MYDDQKIAAVAGETTYVAYNECSHCGHAGINDASETDAACSRCDWSGISPKEDKCPGCGEEGTMVSACPKCGARYGLIAEAHVAAPQSADTRARNVAPLSGHWRHGNGVVSCGTLRIFSENFDTQPADAVKTKIVQWVCDTLNAAREAAPQPSGNALTDEPRAMGENWCVSVEQNGRTNLTISDQALSGEESADENLIVGAAQHLLAFIGYGLPPSDFDPDACVILGADPSSEPAPSCDPADVCAGCRCRYGACYRAPDQAEQPREDKRDD